MNTSLSSLAIDPTQGRCVGDVALSRETPIQAVDGVNRSRAVVEPCPAVRTWDTSAVTSPCITRFSRRVPCDRREPSAVNLLYRRRAVVHRFVIETKGNAYLVTPITGRSVAGVHSPEGNARVVHLDRRAPAHPLPIRLHPHSPVAFIRGAFPATEVPTMAQQELKPFRLADRLYSAERRAIRLATHPDSPEGTLTTPDELAHIQELREARMELERYGEGLQVAVRMIRL